MPAANYQAPFANTMNGRPVECVQCGGVIYPSRRKQHDLYHSEYSAPKGNPNMSQVLWCDNGDHAFKAGEPGSVSFSGQQYDENGVSQQMQMHACRKHNPMARMYEEAELKVLTERAADELRGNS